ncbi:MAG: hypothetical protein HND57_04715 [Planctomycetes bacterium]|nr:hypothetical protein [Planctomycetota bacterium]
MTTSHRLPDFLVIGAMKAGTTTLYRDLLTCPDIFFPADKEPEALATDAVLSDSGTADYAALFHHAAPTQRCGEASTAYTKLPDVTGVTERAKQLLGPDLKVIYIVRHPIERTISHHYHEASAGRAEFDINTAVRNHPRLVDYSRYALQITPWLETFGLAQVHVICFEQYVKNRTDIVNRTLGFLGAATPAARIDSGTVYNKSEGKPVDRGMMARLIQSGLYRTLVRPLLPIGIKDRMRTKLLPQAPPRPDPPTAETKAWLHEQIDPDTERFFDLIGVAANDRWWDNHQDPTPSRDTAESTHDSRQALRGNDDETMAAHRLAGTDAV